MIFFYSKPTETQKNHFKNGCLFCYCCCWCCCCLNIKLLDSFFNEIILVIVCDIILLLVDMPRQVPLCMRKCLSCRFERIYLHSVEPITTIMANKNFFNKKQKHTNNSQMKYCLCFFFISHFIYHEIFLI